jgi:tetratricopeptide (TPR) repeat protein
MPRSRVLFLALLLLQLCAYLEAQQNAGNGATVSINITPDDTREAPKNLHVVILTSFGVPIAETFTNDQSNTEFSGLRVGNYKVRVTGMEIQEATTDFSIIPRQNFEIVSVRVKWKENEQTSTTGSVSAANLNIPSKARHEFDKGIKSLDDNNLDDADKHLAKAIQEYAKYAPAMNARGVVLMREQKPIDAQQMFEQAIAIDSQFSQAYVNLAKLFIQQQKNSEAETLLAKAISADPRDPAPLIVLANLDFNTGRYDDAIQNAQRVHTLPHANAPVAHLIAGMAYQKKQLLPEALAQYKQFLEEAPNSSSADKVRAQIASLEKAVH